MREAVDYMMIQCVKKVTAEEYDRCASMMTIPIWEGTFGDSTHAMLSEERIVPDFAMVLVRYSGGLYEVSLTGCENDTVMDIAKAAFWAVMRRFADEPKVVERACAYNANAFVHDFNQTIDQTEPLYYNTSYVEETDDE